MRAATHLCPGWVRLLLSCGIGGYRAHAASACPCTGKAWQTPAPLPCPAAGGSPGGGALKAQLPAIDIAANCSTPLKALPIAIGGSPGGSPGGGAAAGGGQVSVWGGIQALLRNPHHAAFFATALLMGVG